VTGTNWEDIGVKPDIAIAATDALVAAQITVLDRLAAAPGITPKERENNLWAEIALQAQLNPVTIPPERLSALTRHPGLRPKCGNAAHDCTAPGGVSSPQDHARGLVPIL
jgi:hypothetical protein